MNKTAQGLQEQILAFIGCGRRPAAEDEFTALAREVFAFQFAHNPVYQRYCQSRGRTPETVQRWQDLPAVPTSAFKDFTFAAFPVSEAVAEFHTSGTTRERAGKHYLASLALYHAAIQASFAAQLLPDHARLPAYCLTPSPVEAPHSSLAHMLGVVATQFASRSGFFIRHGQLELDRLVEALCDAREPVCLLGTAFAFVQLLDQCRARQLQFRLAAGSRVMETGGFKGRSREVSKPDLYAGLARLLSVPPHRIVNEYGMTELSTQFYDESLVGGAPTDKKTVPPWARVQIIDPRTGNEAARGQTGTIRVLDLANLWSSIVIQTEDLGSAREDGFELVGRTAGAELRGCSLTAESLELGR